MNVPRKGCLALLPVLCQASLLADEGLNHFRNWKDLRDHGIEKQDLDVSCGSAAAATILRAYYGVPVSEQAVLAEIVKAGMESATSAGERDLLAELILISLSGARTSEDLKKTLLARLLRNQDLFSKLAHAQKKGSIDLDALADKLTKEKLDGTASFADLRKAIRAFGFTAHGLSLSFEQLKTIRIPVIVQLRPRGKGHFSVLRGIERKTGLVLLGDPSWGNRKLMAHRFQAIWSGKILMILPKDNANNANVKRGFFRAPTPNTFAIQHLMLRSNPLHQR